MLNRTLKFNALGLLLFCMGCINVEHNQESLKDLYIQDSTSEARIDSAYRQIRANCDTLMVNQVPQMVDSLLKDSALLMAFFDTGLVFTDADKKVEKVVRQLLADCDSSLQRETYKRARLRLRSGPAQRKKY